MHSHKKGCKGKSRNKGIMFSLLVVGTGVLLLLRNIGIIEEPTSSIIFSWPMIIIAVGFLNLNKYEYGFGIITMGVGAYFLYTRSMGYDLEFGEYFWPVFFIGLGLLVLFVFTRIRSFRRFQLSNGNEDYFEEISIFGGVMKRVTSKDFKGGDIVNVFGGSKLDLRDCQLDEKGAKINFVSVFGGSSFTVPDDWNVKLEVVNILGAMVDKRENPGSDVLKTLVIKGIVIFGGGEVTNFFKID